MSVGIVGSGPAVAAVEAALEDVDVDTATIDVGELPEYDLTVVVGQAGETLFERANQHALDAAANWIAVELGGVGGFPIVDAAVAGFGPETACYECLSGRVSANLNPQAEPAAAPPAHTARFAGAVGGREAARYLADDGATFGEVVEIPHARREFLPLPNCACDTGRSRSLDRGEVDRPLEDALGRAERAVDDQLGIVQEVGEAESFPVPYYLAHSCDTAGFSAVSAARDAAGVDAGWDAAFMKALGEGLERYCAGVYQFDEFKSAPPNGIQGAVPPAQFVCQTDPDPTVEISWVVGEDLATGESVPLPAEFVHYPPPSKRYRPPVTTGLGLGNSGTEALLAGLYEVVERDATMLSWYSTFDPLALDIDDDGYETLQRRADSEGLDVSTLLVTQDVDVPVVVAAVHRGEWPSFAAGSGADLDVTAAARSALAEALQNWMELRGMGPEDAAGASGEIGRYADFPTEVEEYVDADDEVPAASVGPEDVPDGADELDAVVERLTSADLDAYGVRTTTRDVAHLGFEAVRVLVPQAQPLFFGESYFGERAESVPEDMGFAPRLDRDHHPFP
ncbi:YcaO-like family protein [Salinibaculum rarum]|uniref:YcaO-like family protein n=1 Tax=Salinibaculum rarum TaxID=3058903 RepID=UPI00266003F4|nr:YcaO-like family protein [Salinibaculum sp. KK48]